MAGLRDLAKRLLPGRFVNWYRRKRINILEAAGGATRITPRILARAFARKTQPFRAWVRRAILKLFPRRLANWLRRRRVTRQYLHALSWELLERETRLDYLEGRVAARRDGFYERIVHDVLERTEIILQELDRRIEGVSARTGERLHAVEDQLVQLREEIGKLRRVAQLSPERDGDTAAEEKPETETETATATEAETIGPEPAEAGSNGAVQPDEAEVRAEVRAEQSEARTSARE